MSRVVALDIDTQSFWTTDGCLKRVAIGTGDVLFSTCGGGAEALAVVNEPRASLPAPAPDAPTLSAAVLSALCALLALAAVARLRQ